MRKLLVLSVCVFVAACGGTKEQLGLNWQVPDEFKVVTRAPLEMPPDYRLRPPRPGAERPQEQSTAEDASEALFGEAARTRNDITSGEAALLQAAGGDRVIPDIRELVNSEAQEAGDSNKPVAERLLNLSLGRDTVSGDIVDATAERERIEAQEAAKAALEAQD